MLIALQLINYNLHYLGCCLLAQLQGKASSISFYHNATIFAGQETMKSCVLLEETSNNEETTQASEGFELYAFMLKV